MATSSDARARPSLREAQTALARAQIAGAARDLFLVHGYVDTSMTAIARQAQVAVQTVYNVVGNKVAVLSAVLDLVAAGPNSPAPVPQFMAERAGAARNPDELIDVLADWFVELHPRVADLFRLIGQAAAIDPEVTAMERARADQRMRNYTLAAAQLRERGGLTNGLTDEEAAATIWSLGHPNAYRTLVIDLGWPSDSYRHWLVTSLQAGLR